MTGLGWEAGLSLLIGAGKIMENESFTHVIHHGECKVERRCVGLEEGKKAEKDISSAEYFH